MDTNDLVKFIAQELRVKLAEMFVGQINDEDTAKSIKETISKQIASYQSKMVMNPRLPRLEVNITGNTATITAFDPDTGEQLSMQDLIPNIRS